MTPYCTVEEADAYFETRLNTEDWDDASDSEKLKALNMATRAINNLNFRGAPLLTTQQNAFPRVISGLTLNSDVVAEATCEIAINLLDGTDMEQEAENLLAVGQNYATVSTNYNPNLVNEHMRAGIPSVVAWNLLRPYLVNPRTIVIRRG
jgi:hypothetical protein